MALRSAFVTVCSRSIRLKPSLLIAVCLLLAGVTGIPQDQRSTRSPTISSFLAQIQTPLWAQNRSGDILLDFSTADTSAQQQSGQPILFRGQPLNVTKRQGFYHGNLAIVRLGSEVYIAVRQIQFYLTLRSQVAEYPRSKEPSAKWISWWVSRISLCRANPTTLQPSSCSNFEPRNWTDCLWNAGFESLGPEDPRLIVWPGKGLFIMFISKPWPANPSGIKPSDTRCAGPWAQQPWLMPLVTYPQSQSGLSSPLAQKNAAPDGEGADGSKGNAAALDPWLNAGLIRLQYLTHDLGRRSNRTGGGHAVHGALKRKHHGLLKEKNWNPFIYQNELYFSQSFDPHVVIKPSPDGKCTKVYETKVPGFKQLPVKPKGNTQAVLIPAAVSGEAADVFMGIVHVEVNRSYTNYFYKMQAQPPFTITALSGPLPLIPGSHPRIPAWTHISFPMSLQLLEETHQLIIGYGSGDQQSRVKLMGLEEALGLFDRSKEQPAQQPAAAVGAAGG